MSTILTSVKIWAKTVFLTGCVIGVMALWNEELEGILISILVLVAGGFITAPLLLFIDPLVKLSVKLPYSIPARIAWLTFYLVLLIFLFYLLIVIMIEGGLGDISSVFGFTGLTVGPLIIAVLTTRKSLIKINTIVPITENTN